MKLLNTKINGPKIIKTEIYKNFDDQLNKKYKVELNQRTIERVKNSF